MRQVLVLSAILILIIFAVSPSMAIWEENGTLVEPAQEGPYGGSVRDLRMADNGVCGVFLGWFITDNYYNHYQQLNWNGDKSWTPDAISWHLPCCAGVPQIASDNSGGLYITSYGNSIMTYSFIVAHLEPSGSVSDVDFFDGYMEEGAARMHPCMIPDGLTGAIIVWRDIPGGAANTRIRAQRILDETTMGWAANGTILSDTTEASFDPLAASDGYHGAIAAWRDDRDGILRIYAQRIDFLGDLLWADNGIEVCSTRSYQTGHMIIPSVSNGAIIAWVDKRNMEPGNDTDLFIQSLGGDGSLLWDGLGTPLCLATGIQEYPSAVADGEGGAIVIWRDSRSGDYDIYAQRINSEGNAVWADDGIPIAAGPGDQRCGRICADGSGGAMIAWVDESTGESDLYCQSIDNTGSFCWGPGFVPICTASGDQDAIVMTKHCAGGAIISWTDYRNSPYGEIRANWITPSTVDSDTPMLGEEIVLGQNYPNPFNPSTTISFELRSSGPVTLKIYDSAGRLIRTLLDGYRKQGVHTLSWDGLSDSGAKVSSGVYYYQTTAGSKSLSRKMIMLR